jgi:hypothetical protein
MDLGFSLPTAYGGFQGPRDRVVIAMCSDFRNQMGHFLLPFCKSLMKIVFVGIELAFVPVGSNLFNKLWCPDIAMNGVSIARSNPTRSASQALLDPLSDRPGFLT